MHVAHVAVDLLTLLYLTGWSLQGRFTQQRHLHVTIGVLYWHFVDLVWLAVVTTFYLSPYLSGTRP